MNSYEKAALERAHQVYLETERRIEALGEKDKKLFEMLERVEMGNYCPKSSEVLTIARVYDNNAIDSCLAFLKLGFIKGQRAEKNKRRKRNESN